MGNELKWVSCKGDYTGRNKGPYPAITGHYRVLISGDSESEDGHCFYEYPDYETWAYVEFCDDGEISMVGMHDEDIGSILAWCGPIDVPKCNLFDR